MNTMDKEKYSKLLRQDLGWHNVKDCLPKPDQKVLFRFTNESIIYDENDKQVYFSEDAKIGRCVRDFNDPDDMSKCSWVIDPPYVKYDYSPLSRRDKILEGSVVTHWVEATEKDLEEYAHRLDVNPNHLKLRLEADDDTEEDIYRALSHGAACIGMVYGPTEPQDEPRKSDWIKAMGYRASLIELQCLIDNAAYVEDGEVKRLKPLRNPENEDEADEMEEVTSSDMPSMNNERISSIIANASIRLIKELDRNIAANHPAVSKILEEFFDTIGVPMDNAQIKHAFEMINDEKSLADVTEDLKGRIIKEEE